MDTLVFGQAEPAGERPAARPGRPPAEASEHLSRFTTAALAWCRQQFEGEEARKNRCQETLLEYIRRPHPGVEEETRRDLYCIAVAGDPQSFQELNDCREKWGNPVSTDERILAQREQFLNRVYKSQRAYADQVVREFSAFIAPAREVVREEVTTAAGNVLVAETPGAIEQQRTQPVSAEELEQVARVGATPGVPGQAKRAPTTPIQPRRPHFVTPEATAQSAAAGITQDTLNRMLMLLEECLKKIPPTSAKAPG